MAYLAQIFQPIPMRNRRILGFVHDARVLVSPTHIRFYSGPHSQNNQNKQIQSEEKCLRCQPFLTRRVLILDSSCFNVRIYSTDDNLWENRTASQNDEYE